MSAGQNLSGDELQQLHDLLVAFQGSQEVVDIVTTPEDAEALTNTITLINYARVSRPEGETP